MDWLAYLALWLNALANAIGRWLLAPIGVMPGWLSATLAAVVTGILLLLMFKYTSPQHVIKRARNEINANLLALKLFKDCPGVAVRAQGRILAGAGKLFVCALLPMAVMAIPVTVFLGQMGLWYQERPLKVGEDTVLTVSLNQDAPGTLADVALEKNAAVETKVGPVRVPSKYMVCWDIEAKEPGYHRLAFRVNGQEVQKELAIGDGFMRVSAERPGWSWSDMLLHPWEEPFRPNGIVRSIQIAYPERDSWTSGTDLWVVYWFIVSFVSAFAFRKVLRVNV
jgi:hypothetical protein